MWSECLLETLHRESKRGRTVEGTNKKKKEKKNTKALIRKSKTGARKRITTTPEHQDMTGNSVRNCIK